MLRSNDLFKTLVDAIPDIIFFKDKDGAHLLANKAYQQMLGLNEENIIGKSDADLLPPDLCESCADSDRRVFESRKTLMSDENETDEDGNVTFYETLKIPVLNHEGEVTGLIGMARDISERMRAAQTLAESEERYRSLFEFSPDSITILDMNGTIVDLNRAALAIGKVTKEEVAGRYFLDLSQLDPLDISLFQDLFVRSSSGEVIKGLEINVKDSEGEEKELELYVSPITRGGKVEMLHVITRDVTERNKEKKEKELLQKQLFNTRKLEAVGRLAGGMAHDFNNMLAIIMGNANLGIQDLSPDQYGYEEFSEILNAAERAKTLSMKLLTLAKKEKMDAAPHSVNSVLEHVISSLEISPDKNINIETSLDKNCACTFMDVNQIRQAISNIIRNSCDAISGSGTVYVRSNSVIIDEELYDGIAGMNPGRFNEITIEDTGCGMDDETIEKIFDPFFTTKRKDKGAGLGLTITHRIIKEHKGRISIISKPGEGTTFRILLPAFENEPERKPGKKSKPSDAGDSETILLVDDEMSFLKMAERILTRAGYKTIACDSGKEAVNIYSGNPGGIDLVILDMIMPGMDGNAVFDAIRKTDPDAKIVISSGYSRNGHAEELVKKGANGFVQKPFMIEEICGTIRRVLDFRAS
ncbi:MAG TPA: PAS domain S-box protein [bacterium]|nr:PAS domain S-box protein [bacterium]